MLKAVVFDDEYIVLQGLRSMIDWSQYGIELTAMASDGQTALSLFHEHGPDIVFTDIRMPGLDGLQLIEEIMREAPETVCIVFSGFNEFEYVKRAIKLGVVDYLEKPITIPKIEEALRKALDRIQHQKEVQALKSKWEESRHELLEKATLDLLLNGTECEMKWRESFGSDADLVVGATVLAFTALNHALPLHSSYRVISLLNGSEKLAVVFHYSLPAEELWEQLQSLCEQTGESVGIGQTYAHAGDAAKSYKEALRSLKYGRFLEGKGLTYFADLGENSKLPKGLSEHEESVIFLMRTGDKSGLLQQLDQFIQQVEAENVDRDMLEREILRLVYMGIEVAKESGGDAVRMQQSAYLPHIELRDMQTREQMTRWLRNQMEMIMDQSLLVRQSLKHTAVEQAVRYMDEHYHCDLTLQEVALHVQMHPAYFSLLFKEEMGITYIKHLTKIRMEQAKGLLREGMLVNEVSEKVGYLHYRHFTEVFKKHTGMTPGQYRDGSKSSKQA